MDYKISQELLEKILNYLAGRPWLEVQKLMQDLSQCQPCQSEEPPKSE